LRKNVVMLGPGFCFGRLRARVAAEVPGCILGALVRPSPPSSVRLALDPLGAGGADADGRLLAVSRMSPLLSASSRFASSAWARSRFLPRVAGPAACPGVGARCVLVTVRLSIARVFSSETVSDPLWAEASGTLVVGAPAAWGGSADVLGSASSSMSNCALWLRLLVSACSLKASLISVPEEPRIPRALRVRFRLSITRSFEGTGVGLTPCVLAQWSKN
jgi:hypothetical protein